MREFKISVYPSRPDGAPTQTSNQATTLTASLGELLDSLTDHMEVTDKYLAPAWSPITYSNGRRLGAEAVSVCALVYDLDSCGAEGWGPIREKLSAVGWTYALHETYSEGASRLVIPLEEDLPIEAHEEAWRDVAEELGLEQDEACKDRARLYFAPSRPVGVERKAAHGGSELYKPSKEFSLRKALARTVPRGGGVAGTHGGWEPTPGEGAADPRPGEKRAKGPEKKPHEKNGLPHDEKPFDMETLRKEVSEDGHARAPDTLALLDGTLRLPPGERNARMHGLLSWLSHRRNCPSLEVTMSLVERVLSCREGAGEHLQEWMKEARNSYSRGLLAKAQKDIAAAEALSFFKPDQGSDDAWKARLQIVTNKQGVPTLVANELNILAVLKNDPNFKGAVRWNVMTNEVEVMGGLLKGFPQDAPEAEMAAWFQGSEYRCLKANQGLMTSCLNSVALGSEYNPVMEYIRTLPEWDGRERCDSLLLRHAQAKGSEDWIKLVTKKFLISCMARALKPGCQVDTVLILQGAQGGGKTSFVRTLAKGFHAETTINFHDKDGVMMVNRNWLVELGELASMRRSDIETVRNFITRTHDQIRLPYGRKVKSLPRRCAFIGTTNNERPLTDPDGNRRFWVVRVGKFDSFAIQNEVDQIWAEARYYYETGVDWWLNDEEAKQAALEARPFEEVNQYTEILEDWLENLGDKRPASLTAMDFRTKVMNTRSDDTRHETKNIHAAMRQMGWKEGRKLVGTSKVKAFTVPSKAEVERAKLEDETTN